MTNQSLSEEIRRAAGDGTNDAEFLVFYFGLLHEWADRIEELEDHIMQAESWSFVSFHDNLYAMQGGRVHKMDEETNEWVLVNTIGTQEP